MKRSYIAFLLYCLIFCNCTEQNEAAKKEAVQIKNTTDKKWVGKWTRNVWANTGVIEITTIEGDSITFRLVASSGGHLGDIEGKAEVRGDNAVFFETIDYDTCKIEFERFGDSLIVINQIRGNCFAAMGVEYSGKYYNDEYSMHDDTTKDLAGETLVTLGLLNSTEDSLFRTIVGEDYELFLNSTQLTSEDIDEDSLNAKVYASGVRGLYTFMENIIIISSTLDIWAAVIDDNMVNYYTNRPDYIEKLPLTIDDWRSNFSEYPVVYKSKHKN